MKKNLLLFTFILSLVSARVLAQNAIEIYDNNNKLITGTTISVDSSNNTVETMDQVLKVKNNTADNMSMYVRRIIKSELPGTSNVICFGVTCYGPFTDTSLEARIVPAGKIDSSFLSHYSPYDLDNNLMTGITSITYEFFDNRSAGGPVSAQVTVNYNLSLVGLGSELKMFDIKAAYPNPASYSTSIEYKIPAGSNGKIVVHNLLGSIVREENLDNQEGKIVLNTTDLKDGIYFYSVMLNNKVEVTRKLIIRH